MGTSKRKDINDSAMIKIVPGPGTYDHRKFVVTAKQNPSWGFGKGTRPNLNAKSMTGQLGPGQYVVPSKAIEGPKYIIGQINHNEKKYSSVSPGPGTYQPELMTTAHSFSMG
jgi:hypothetical protein